jgi:hypothetical protein
VPAPTLSVTDHDQQAPLDQGSRDKRARPAEDAHGRPWLTCAWSLASHFHAACDAKTISETPPCGRQRCQPAFAGLAVQSTIPRVGS